MEKKKYKEKKDKNPWESEDGAGSAILGTGGPLVG